MGVLHFWWFPGLSQNLSNPVRSRTEVGPKSDRKSGPKYGVGPKSEVGQKSGPKSEVGPKSGPKYGVGPKSGPKYGVGPKSEVGPESGPKSVRSWSEVRSRTEVGRFFQNFGRSCHFWLF